LLLAWKNFKSQKSNKKDVQIWQRNLVENLFELNVTLKSKTYRHSGYHAFKISDPKPRDIHKASVSDRVLHHAIYQKMYFFLDSKFISDSYSCRINKGTHKAIDRFRHFAGKVSKNNTKTCWVLKCDIRKFFANIDHQILKNILKKHIEDQDTLLLLSNVIDSFCSNPIGLSYGVNSISDMADMQKVGLPLGNLTSQLLVNVYMNEFDQFMKHKLKTKYYVRYADDFAIFSENKEYLEETLRYIEVFLRDELKLNLHPDKVFIKTYASGVDFLGWVNFPNHKVLRTTTKRRMFRNIAKTKNEASLESYKGMLNHGNGYNLQKRLIKMSEK